MNDFTPQEQADARTRLVHGEGTPFLRVPQLTKLEALRIGALPLPLSEVRRYPTDALGGFESVDEPLVQIQHASDGVPVLVRSLLSNDGIWTHSVGVFVTGEWEEEGADSR